MAQQSSDQTIREMLAGFSAMQFNLGLLPMQTTQAMGGSPPQALMAPPQIQHPGQAAAIAIAQHQAMIQQTLHAAQATRHQPPPSAPVPAVSAMAGFAESNPFAAPVIGASPASRAYASPSAAPALPSIFNPFSPALPPPHFMPPSARSLQLMQSGHAQMLGTLSGVTQGAFGIGGAVAGGVLGSAFGPLGAAAGSWLGSRIGNGLGGLTIGPSAMDMARGRHIEAMTAHSMVSGAFLSAASGQGMSAVAARQAATGLRRMQGDYDFERTGFNAQDALRIMQASSDQGLIKGAMSPDQLVQKVKDISKTVKVLMRITGDPDVRDAIASLGQMRELGFQGLASQAGAIANRAAFARMAGVSQAAMGEYGMMGAATAAQFGLGGATGYVAGMSGAGLASMAVSSGALNDLQLARAGGKSGLASINARGQLAAMQDERYLLAAMGRDAKGRMTVDMDAYRRAQGMSFQEVTERSAEALRAMGKEGIFEWNTRKQEFKDQVAQKLSPLEMNMNMIRQARAFQSAVPGMTMGTALQLTTGMSNDEARALELQTQSRGWYDAQVQQLEAQKRQAQDQLAAQREQYRTPGFGTRVRRGIRSAISGLGDSLSSPFTRLGERFQRVAEDEEAAERGERISRYDDAQIAHDDAERRMLRTGLRSGEFQRAYRRAGRSFLDEDRGAGDSLARHLGRQMNRIGSFLGLAAQSDENRLVSIASRSYGSAFGWHPLASFGDAGEAMGRVRSLIGAGRAADDAAAFGAREIAAVTGSVNAAGMASAGARSRNFSGGAVLREASRNLVSRLKDLKAGIVSSATAVSADDLKDAYVKAARKAGMSDSEASASYEKNKDRINASMANDVYATNDKGIIEPFAKAQEAATAAGAVDLSRSREGVQASIDTDMRILGLDQREMRVTGMGRMELSGYRASDATMRKLKSVIAHSDEDVVAIASAQGAMMQGDARGRDSGAALLNDLERSMGTEKYAEKKALADKLLKSMDSDTQQALRQLSKGTVSGQALIGLVGKSKEMFGKGMALAATNEFLQRLDDKQKGLGGAASAQDAVDQLSWETVDRIGKADKRFADMLRRAKGGDQTAMEEAIVYASPTAAQARHGGGEGAGVDAIERQIADLKELRDQVAKEDDGSKSDQLQAASSQLFSSAVERFGKFVDDLTGSGEGRALYDAQPWIQAQKGST